jgi:peptide/nickel transport system substrate-binding protein
LRLGSASVTFGIAGCERVEINIDTGGGSAEATDADKRPTATDTQTPTEEQATATTEESGGTLTIAQAGTPSGFDPFVRGNMASRSIANQIFEGLYGYDRNTGTVPELATGTPTISSGETRYTVSIEQTATFSNGDPVTAEDVVYSFTAPVREGTRKADNFNIIDTVSAVDSKTVQFDLSEPYGPFMHVLTSAVVPKAVREQDKNGFSTNPIGSGPFTLAKFKQGDITRLVADEDHWDGDIPSVDTVELRPVTDEPRRVTSLQNGDALVAERIPERFVDTVRQTTDVTIQQQPTLSYYYVGMNCKEGPTTSNAVREAVDYTFNMDRAVREFTDGVRQYSPIPKQVAKTWEFPTTQWSTIPHDKDISTAQSLFEQTGVPSDYDWRIIVPANDTLEQIGVSVGNGLQEAGFENVSVQRLDWQSFLASYVTGNENDYNIFATSWSGIPDPDGFLYPLLSRANDTLGATNATYYGANSANGEAVARKITQARESTEFETRRRLYIDAITTMLKDRPHLPAYALQSTWGVRDTVSGFVPHPADEFHLSTSHNNVSIDSS